MCVGILWQQRAASARPLIRHRHLSAVIRTPALGTPLDQPQQGGERDAHSRDQDDADHHLVGCAQFAVARFDLEGN
jgi:hypothetical protein